MHPRSIVLVRILAVPALILAASQVAGRPAAAAGNRPLSFADFANPLDAHDISGTADGAVAGVHFARALAEQ